MVRVNKGKKTTLEETEAAPPSLFVIMLISSVNLIIVVERLSSVHTPGEGGTPYNGLYGEAPPEGVLFFRLQVYERVGISRAEVYERVGKSVI